MFAFLVYPFINVVVFTVHFLPGCCFQLIVIISTRDLCFLCLQFSSPPHHSGERSMGMDSEQGAHVLKFSSVGTLRKSIPKPQQGGVIFWEGSEGCCSQYRGSTELTG